MSAALNLYRLQQIDSSIDKAEARLAAIREILEHDAELSAARQEQERASAAVKESERTLKAAEDEATSQRIKLEQAESSLYSGRIHNPKELKDLQNDSASLKKWLTELEDAQLEAMLTLEQARADLETAKNNFTAAQGRAISRNASLNSENETLQKEIERLTSQRLATTPGIEAAALADYNHLRQQRRGLAVATVSDNACDACGAALTPGLAQSARISSKIVHCSMCGRILFST